MKKLVKLYSVPNWQIYSYFGLELLNFHNIVSFKLFMAIWSVFENFTAQAVPGADKQNTFIESLQNVKSLGTLWYMTLQFDKNKQIVTIVQHTTLSDKNFTVHCTVTEFTSFPSDGFTMVIHCKCLQGFTGTLQENRSAAISNLL